MPIRITTYKQAFEDVLGVPFDEKMQAIVRELEKEGHTEKGISFAIWRSQDKLLAFKRDSRFISILKNEINKWSWKKDDPRWVEYWNRKREEERAERIRKEIDACIQEERGLKEIDWRAAKPPKKPKGYIYFFQGQCGGAIKIGYSVDPQKRLKELQTGYPDTLKVLLMIPGSENTERALHKHFEASRLKGEWFRPDPYVIEKIKELKAKYGQIDI